MVAVAMVTVVEAMLVVATAVVVTVEAVVMAAASTEVAATAEDIANPALAESNQNAPTLRQGWSISFARRSPPQALAQISDRREKEQEAECEKQPQEVDEGLRVRFLGCVVGEAAPPHAYRYEQEHPLRVLAKEISP